MPTPLNRWKDSKVLLPTRYLAAAVHYLVYSQVDEAHPMMNKHVAGKFVLSPNNLHRILTGQRYVGGHESTKIRSEDMGEKYVKVTAVAAEAGKGKGKGKGKSNSEDTKMGTSKGGVKPSGAKVTVTKVAPKIVPLPFLTEPPARGTRGAKRRKKDGDPKDKE